MRDLPSSLDLLALGRELLLDELLPLLPRERQRDLRLVATSIAIAAREANGGEGSWREILRALKHLYPEGEGELSGRDDPAPLLRRLAVDLRAGAFETSESRERAARAILWRLTILKLREGNPRFLAANGLV